MAVNEEMGDNRGQDKSRRGEEQHSKSKPLRVTRHDSKV